MIIGSVALKHHFPELNREPKDVDIVAFDEYDKQDLIRIHRGSFKRVEVLINPVLLNWFKQKKSIPQICTKDELYTLKISHVFWKLENNSWDKHMWDIQFMKDKGCQFIPELFESLYKYWNTVHGENKRSKLDMSADEFFDNALTCEYEHDYLHTLINSTPTYLKVLKDGCEVDVSEEKFNSLSFEDKCNLVYEEVEVMAYERNFHKDYRFRYGRMLKKFIINHAPIWEAIFIIENYKLLCKPRQDFMKLINNKLKQNELSTI